MRRVLTALLVLGLAPAAAACAGQTAPHDDAAYTTTAAPSPTVTPADRVDVNTAAISRYLTSSENSFPGTTFRVVFVLDRPGRDLVHLRPAP